MKYDKWFSYSFHFGTELVSLGFLEHWPSSLKPMASIILLDVQIIWFSLAWFSYPSFHCSVAASSATKMAYSSAAYFSQSVSSCASVSIYRKQTFSKVKDYSNNEQQWGCHPNGQSRTRTVEKGSFCSWSKYLSRFKKVSKNRFACLHFFRSWRVILPVKNNKIFLNVHKCITYKPQGFII